MTFGLQFFNNFSLLIGRYLGLDAINFELPDKSWALDNTNNIEELFRLGRTSAAQEFERLAPKFFDVAKKDFVPYRG